MTAAMVDNIALAISHGLLAIACWRLLTRADLDRDDGVPRKFGRRPGLRPETTPEPGADA